MTAYYNEIDPVAAQWLRNLIAAGQIAPGHVDERSIEDVHPSDLRGFTQCHFFAGIGVWSYALRAAGWADDRPVWTGSCPCQPFSSAGKGAGFADERHLWPAFYHLIGQRRPPEVLGEQVASADALAWLDVVHADLEGAGYAVGAADLCAAGVGAPHIRQRLFWVGNAIGTGSEGHARHGRATGRKGLGRSVAQAGVFGGLADGDISGRGSLAIAGVHDAERHAEPCGSAGGLADAEGDGRKRGRRLDKSPGRNGITHNGATERPGPANGFWRDADWLLCRDGRWRPVEPGTFPLAHGVAGRVGRLRAYGNAIVAQAAEAFIRAVM